MPPFILYHFLQYISFNGMTFLFHSTKLRLICKYRLYQLVNRGLLCHNNHGDKMKKILVIGTGGTIGAKSGKSVTLDSPLKITELYSNPQNAEFECAAPFEIFSEHSDPQFLQNLCSYVQNIDFEKFAGVILLHGSDTMTFTGALLAHLFPEKRLVLVGADKPPDNPDSNALANFDCAVRHLLFSGLAGVYIAYDGLHHAWKTTAADCTDTFREANVSFCPVEAPKFNAKNILIITPHPCINYDAFNLDGVDAVIHTMYHSATAPKGSEEFSRRCIEKGIQFYFVTHRSSADYETAENLSNIMFSSTTENAWAKLLLTK